MDHYQYRVLSPIKAGDTAAQVDDVIVMNEVDGDEHVDSGHLELFDDAPVAAPAAGDKAMKPAAAAKKATKKKAGK